jgi:hypothetical protein
VIVPASKPQKSASVARGRAGTRRVASNAVSTAKDSNGYAYLTTNCLSGSGISDAHFITGVVFGESVNSVRANRPAFDIEQLSWTAIQHRRPP